MCPDCIRVSEALHMLTHCRRCAEALKRGGDG